VKAAQKYLQLLEKELERAHADLVTARKDIEFYRAKVERLELAMAQTSSAPAQQEYAERTNAIDPKLRPRIDHVLKQQTPRHMPFSELKSRWMQLSEAEQEKALADGWKIEEPKEEPSNAGS
jgi:hypothetical protein